MNVTEYLKRRGWQEQADGGVTQWLEPDQGPNSVRALCGLQGAFLTQTARDADALDDITARLAATTAALEAAQAEREKEVAWRQNEIDSLRRELAEANKLNRWQAESLASFRSKFDAPSNCQALDAIDNLKTVTRGYELRFKTLEPKLKDCERALEAEASAHRATTQELDAVKYAAHMPDDYEFGLPSWINQRLYTCWIGMTLSPAVSDLIDGEVYSRTARLKGQLEDAQAIRVTDELTGKWSDEARAAVSEIQSRFDIELHSSKFLAEWVKRCEAAESKLATENAILDRLCEITKTVRVEGDEDMVATFERVIGERSAAQAEVKHWQDYMQSESPEDNEIKVRAIASEVHREVLDELERERQLEAEIERLTTRAASVGQAVKAMMERENEIASTHELAAVRTFHNGRINVLKDVLVALSAEGDDK